MGVPVGEAARPDASGAPVPSVVVDPTSVVATGVAEAATTSAFPSGAGPMTK